MLTAIAAWGDWHPPAEPIELSATPTRAEVRQLRFGRTRRLEEAGALARVLVLDTRRRAPELSAPRSGTGSHAPPATHLRRAHWQRYRHGSPDDWQYERHWIPPVLVNPQGTGAPRPRVYRLPLPEVSQTTNSGAGR